MRRNAWLLLALCLAVFASRLFMFAKSAEPNGVDGYYYAMEAKSFMERGYFENFTVSPPYYFCGILAWAIKSPLWGVRLCSAIFSALLPVAVFLLMRELTRGLGKDPSIRARDDFDERGSTSGVSMGAAILTACSPSLAYMSVNYIANLGALCFGIFSLALLGRFGATRRYRMLALGTVLALVAALSHLTAAVYITACIGLYALYRIRKPWLVGLLGLASVALVVVFRDQLERFSGVFAFGPAIPALSSVFRTRLPSAVYIELSALFVAAYACVGLSWWKEKSFRHWFLLVPVFFFPFWNLDRLDMGFRLLLASVPAGLIVVAHTGSKYLRKKRTSLGSVARISISAVVSLAIFLNTAIYDPHRDPPYASYRRVIDSVDLPEDSLLIAHLGLNHVYTYYKGFRDCLNYVPDFPVPRERLWRLAYGVPYQVLAAQFPAEAAAGALRDLPGEYTLVREDNWNRFLDGEEPMVRESLRTWYNPYTVRPAFIRTKRR